MREFGKNVQKITLNQVMMMNVMIVQIKPIEVMENIEFDIPNDWNIEFMPCFIIEIQMCKLFKQNTDEYLVEVKVQPHNQE